MPITRELFIGGKDVPAASGRTTEDVNPYTGEVYATVAAAGPEDVRRAVDAADAAFEEWAALAPFARRAIFLKAADLLDARGDQVAELMANEAGRHPPVGVLQRGPRGEHAARGGGRRHRAAR